MRTAARPFMIKCLHQHHHSDSFQLLIYTFYHINFILQMKDIKKTFFTSNSKPSLLNSQYITPKQYIDCRRILQDKLNSDPKHRKKQLTTKQKQKYQKKFYLDQTIKSFKDNPSPNRYTQNYSTIKRYKSQSTFITKHKKQQLELGKRPTWIEDIEKYQQKYKPPSVGKYNLLTKSDFLVPKKKQQIQKLLKNGKKFNNLDDVVFVSSQIPGPGSHNPQKSIPKLKVNMTGPKQWKKKNKIDTERMKKKLDQSSVSSCSYTPVKYKTFDSFSKLPKKDATLMKISQIDKRQGLTKKFVSPGPGAHQTLNKWGKQTFKRQNLLGKLNIFSKTTRSFPTLKIYH